MQEMEKKMESLLKVRKRLQLKARTLQVEMGELKVVLSQLEATQDPNDKAQELLEKSKGNRKY